MGGRLLQEGRGRGDQSKVEVSDHKAGTHQTTLDHDLQKRHMISMILIAGDTHDDLERNLTYG